MESITDTNAKRQRVANIAKFAIGFIGAVVISPFVFLAVKGLVGLAIAGAVGLAIVNFAPAVAMKFANWKVKAIVAEAKANPIETLNNLLIAKRQAFVEFKHQVENASAAERDFAEKVRQFKVQYPARAPEFESQLAAMHTLVQQKIVALQNAQVAIHQGEDKLKEMQAYWDMSQAAQKANRAANMDTGDLYEKLKADTACDAVFESMNKAFAQVDIAAALETAPGIPNIGSSSSTPQLTNQTADVVEMAAVRSAQKVRV